MQVELLHVVFLLAFLGIWVLATSVACDTSRDARSPRTRTGDLDHLHPHVTPEANRGLRSTTVRRRFADPLDTGPTHHDS